MVWGLSLVTLLKVLIYIIFCFKPKIKRNAWPLGTTLGSSPATHDSEVDPGSVLAGAGGFVGQVPP